MKNKFMFVLVGLMLLSACGAPKSNAMEARDAWARAGLKDGNSAAYMLISNGTAQNDELVGVSSDAAKAVEIHLSQLGADGTMQMLPQEAIALPAGGELELKPGSYHVMLIGLVKDLNLGDEITLTLHFQNHVDISLTVPVKEAADMGGSGMDGHNSMP